MALIIQLQPVPVSDNVGAQFGACERHEAAPPAEVILFPGVRYARWGDDEDASRGAYRNASLSVERDWLEI